MQIQQGKGVLASAVAGPLLAVTASSINSLTGPSGFSYRWVVLSNVSPWVATCSGANGTRTVPPYTADVFDTSASGNLNVTMSVPPGGSATPPSGALTYVQADWYIVGGQPPAGTYPVSLASQAIEAAISFAETLYGPFTTRTTTIAPPSTTQSLIVIGSGSAGAPEVEGNTTGLDYFVLSPPNGIPRWEAQIDPVAEPAGFTVGWPSGSNPTTWWVLANTAVEVVAAWDVADGIATESAGGGESVMTLVGGSDGSGIYQTLPVAAAGTVTPPNVAVVGGTDGTDARQLSTDTAGRLILPPATNTATLVATLTTTSGGSALFGPTSAVNAKWVEMVLQIDSATTAAATQVTLAVTATTSGIVLGKIKCFLPTTANIPVTGLGPLVVTVPFGPGGLTIPAAATDDFTLTWTYTSAPSAISAFCDVVVGY